ncbi:hypothetical protein N136_00556 [Leifsonia aquatica ATCC 14665]|uniref:Uncharacterized protein n=1 Tax=Leifsonia aquatica ATCC 14665 TaxID=1358026 RepID=U2RCW6_LEIAQ|nr:hypothetical protein N136_00556 [Leifsonia aquatica ATCC 14665]
MSSRDRSRSAPPMMRRRPRRSRQRPRPVIDDGRSDDPGFGAGGRAGARRQVRDSWPSCEGAVLFGAAARFDVEHDTQ